MKRRRRGRGRGSREERIASKSFLWQREGVPVVRVRDWIASETLGRTERANGRIMRLFFFLDSRGLR